MCGHLQPALFALLSTQIFFSPKQHRSSCLEAPSLATELLQSPPDPAHTTLLFSPPRLHPHLGHQDVQPPETIYVNVGTHLVLQCYKTAFSRF